MHPILRGLLGSLSLAAGYVPIAFSFALAALQAGLSPGLTLMTSVVVFAGASQFILIALLTSGAGVLATVGTVALINARHLFYGPALLARLRLDRPRLPTPLLAFGLTDEVFATASGRTNSQPPQEREWWYVGLQLGAYGAWVGGTLLGVLMGGHIGTIPPALDAALGFILPALFFALLLELPLREWAGTLLLTGAITLILTLLLPAHHALALGMIAGALGRALAPHRQV